MTPTTASTLPSYVTRALGQSDGPTVGNVIVWLFIAALLLWLLCGVIELVVTIVRDTPADGVGADRVERNRAIVASLPPSRMVTNVQPIRRPYDQDAEELAP